MLKVGVLGATGMVGRTYVSLLENHPWFEVVSLAASPRSAGKKYSDLVRESWHLQKEVPASVRDLTVEDTANVDAFKNCDFVFSALDSQAAKEFEHIYAQEGIPVVSNASAHRSDPDVPMIIPEINAHHLDVIPAQKKNRNWKGFIAVKPNCSIQSYLAPLYALRDFLPQKVIVTTMQAVSGAGCCTVEELDMTDNVVPFIGGEEEKSEHEPLKILGSVENGQIVPARAFSISAHCNRVAVTDGHLASVSVSFENKPSQEQIIERWKHFPSIDLPSAPKHPIVYRDEPDRPQPRLDRGNEHGMAVTVGRLRSCNVLDYRFTGLSHNTVRGAAGGGILNAELLKSKGYL